MCRLSRNQGASTSWNLQGLSRPAMELLYLLCSLLSPIQVSALGSGPVARPIIRPFQKLTVKKMNWIVRIGSFCSRSLQILDFVTANSFREQLTKNDTRACVSETAGRGGRVGEVELDQLPYVVYSKIHKENLPPAIVVFSVTNLYAYFKSGVLQTFVLAFRWIKFNYVFANMVAIWIKSWNWIEWPTPGISYVISPAVLHISKYVWFMF